MRVLCTCTQIGQVVEKGIFGHSCVLNARILYNSIHTNRTLSNVDFRMYLIQGLLLTWKNGPVTHVQMSNPCVSEGAQHFPGKNVTGKKRDCIVCSTKAQRRQTRTICK